MVCRRGIPLAPSTPLAAMFIDMLVQMGVGGRIHIECSPDWVDVDWLQESIPRVEIETDRKSKGGWVSIRRRSNASIDHEAVRCSFSGLRRGRGALRGFFEGEYEDALRAYRARPPKPPFVWNGDLRQREDIFPSMFTYGHSWALRTRGVLDHVTATLGRSESMRCVDIGGAHGFLACELAAAGHEAVNVELFEPRFRIQEWMSKALGVADRVSGVWSPMQAWVEGEAAKQFDLATFMGSLICIDRDEVVAMLERTAGLLRPGGLIIVREGVRPESRRVGRLKTFSHGELYSLLDSAGGELSLFNHLGKPLTVEESKNVGVWFAVIRFD